jgi:OOP family OmpA-OmpF porin
MKFRIIHLAVLMAAMSGVSQVLADEGEGYWFNSSGEVWRNSAGECVHTNYWVIEQAIIGCDGKVAEEPVEEPAPAPVVAIPPAEATVNFAFDSSDLDGTATSAIDTLVSDAKAQGSIKSVRVTGHTDRVGTEDYNMGLSQRRASAVNDYLVENAGIDPQMIELVGKGESEPLAECAGMRGPSALECLAPNRRAEIVFDLF